MVGFRAAGWTCFAAGVVSLIIAAVGLWGTGIVGEARKEDEKEDGVKVSSDNSAGSSVTEFGEEEGQKDKQNEVVEIV